MTTLRLRGRPGCRVLSVVLLSYCVPTSRGQSFTEPNTSNPDSTPSFVPIVAAVMGTFAGLVLLSVLFRCVRAQRQMEANKAFIQANSGASAGYNVQGSNRYGFNVGAPVTRPLSSRRQQQQQPGRGGGLGRDASVSIPLTSQDANDDDHAYRQDNDYRGAGRDNGWESLEAHPSQIRRPGAGPIPSDTGRQGQGSTVTSPTRADRPLPSSPPPPPRDPYPNPNAGHRTGTDEITIPDIPPPSYESLPPSPS